MDQSTPQHNRNIFSSRTLSHTHKQIKRSKNGCLHWFSLGRPPGGAPLDAADQGAVPSGVEALHRHQVVQGSGRRRRGYRFFVGSMPEIRRMMAAGSEVILDAGSHDFIPIVQPQFRKWIANYGMCGN